MRHPVIVIGLESAPVPLLEKWMNAGCLPVLADLRRRGAFGRLWNVDYHATESEWTTFQTGRLPSETGYWRPLKHNPANYRVDAIGAYDFVDHQPFWALGQDYKVAAFDVPQSTLSPLVNGPQVLAWGAHDPQNMRSAHPPELFSELMETYGDHPAFLNAFGNNWWDLRYLHNLEHGLKAGVSRRAAIACDLLQRDDWDLFVTVFGETHGAGHNLWHFSQTDHPLHAVADAAGFDHDPMLEVFQTIDAGVGEILAAAPENANIVIVNALGMAPNYNELPSMMMLGEFLYRFNFPGREAFSFDAPGTPLPPLLQPDERESWGTAVWAHSNDARKLRERLLRMLPRRRRALADRVMRKFERKLGISQDGMTSPYQLSAAGDRLQEMPTSWYRQYWPQMSAFALPSYSDGLIRINLRGREAQGFVEPSDYDAVCRSVMDALHTLMDPRSQTPMVEKIIRTRKSPDDDDPNLPDADLVVVWAETPTDVVESEIVGRIGPIPYRRSGGHHPLGCVIAAGPDIAAGTRFKEARAEDIAPTILDLMGASTPEGLSGHSLLQRSTELAPAQ